MAKNNEARFRTNAAKKFPDTIGNRERNDEKSKHKKTFATPSNITIIAVMVIIILSVGYWRYRSMLKELVRLPLDVPKINEDNATSAAVSPGRFWGSYRSNLYFGMKTRTPNSPVFGLMWLTQFDNQMPAPVRHWCDQGDGLLKRVGGKHGGDWTAKISVTPKVRCTTVIFNDSRKSQI
jgi:mannosyl-oligosaccharide glucosidase